MPALSIDQALRYAAERHAAGFSSEAEAIVGQVLAAQPANAEAKNLLGRMALDCGKIVEAAALIGEAVRALPHEPRYQVSWSLVQRAQGDWNAAIAAARRAVDVAPAYAPAWLHLSTILAEHRDLSGAEHACRAAIAAAPDLAIAHNDLGILLDEMGRKDEAIAELHTALRLQPAYPDAAGNLALLLSARGDHAAAVSVLQETLRRHPDFVRAWRILGRALRHLGRLSESVGALRRAIQIQPRDAPAHNELGVSLWQDRKRDGALDAWRSAIRLDPQLIGAYHHLGVAGLAGNEMEEAHACYQRLLELEPRNAWHHNNLAAALNALGDHNRAIARFREALALDPGNSHIHSALICAALFHPDFHAEMIRAECEKWDRRHGQREANTSPTHENSRIASRRLRIGYVSPNFWSHVVGRNIQPLLAHHDHQQFEVFCYADMRVVDDLTTELTGYADHWCNTVDLSHEALAQKIRSDTIDILVDLNLHLANDRLPVFARRPAPVQVAFAGYPGTTGLRAIDYRLTDPYLDPPGENDDFYSEESIRLPHSFWCYAPREDIGVNELPAATTGIVTFGCLNNFVKVNVPVLQLWGQVLQAVPGSRLLLSAPEGRGRTRALATFEGLGIEPSRVEFVVKTSHRDYLLHYHRIDIMLDTFPYNGHTTSLDALWMGVPVITLAGCHAVARAGLSQLTNVGFPDGIAASPAEYVERARLLAANLKGLAQLRGELRQRMEASPLMDAVGFTRGIESAYQSMWECWRTRN